MPNCISGNLQFVAPQDNIIFIGPILDVPVIMWIPRQRFHLLLCNPNKNLARIVDIIYTVTLLSKAYESLGEHQYRRLEVGQGWTDKAIINKALVSPS